MSYERHYYTRPRLIPPAIPISLLLASALYIAGQFVELPSVSGQQLGFTATLSSDPRNASPSPAAAQHRPGQRTVHAAYLTSK